MRLCLAKYSDFLNFTETDMSGRWGPAHRLREERTKLLFEVNLPEVANESETSFINQMKDDGLQDWSINEVLYCRKWNQSWSYEIDFSQPTGESIGQVDLLFRKNEPSQPRSYSFYEHPHPIRFYIRGIHTYTMVQVVFHFGDKFIFFDDIDLYGVHFSGSKSIPNEVIKELRQVPPDQIQVALYAVVLDHPFNTQGSVLTNLVRSRNADCFNCKMFLEEYRTDVIIVSSEGQLVDCHYDYIRNVKSPVLTGVLVRPTTFGPPCVVYMPDLTKTAVVAFLRYQYCGETDMILGSVDTSMRVLKAAERYKIKNLWNDSISGIFEQDYDWFEDEATSELVKFLRKCSKRKEKATQHLLRKLSVALEQTIQGVKDNQQPGDHGVNPQHAKEKGLFKLETNLNSIVKGGKRRKLSTNHQLTGTGKEIPLANGVASTSPPDNLNLRRSARLEAKSQEVRGGQNKDKSWQQALQIDAKQNKSSPMWGKPMYGPRDIWKDPVLPKVAIIPDPEVKVEKVEPLEDEEYPSGVATAEVKHELDEEHAAVVVKEEESMLMDELSGAMHSCAEYGVIKEEVEETD